MKIPFLDLAWQHNIIKNALAQRFEEIMSQSAFVGGKALEDFERNFAAYCEVPYAVGVASGTDALILALRALGIGAGDEVITIPTTFVATASAVLHVGAKPVFVDIDPKTRDFNFELLRKGITPRTKAIMPVHLYGQAAGMDEIQRIVMIHNLKIIEDASQSHGAIYRGRKVGTLGDVGCFSFYPGKNLGAYGEGGMVVTKDEGLATLVKELRNHGGIGKYEHKSLGYNSRLDALQAAVLDEKLKYLDEWNKKRREIASLYQKHLGGIEELQIFAPRPDTEAVYHLYAVKLLRGDRADFMKYLSERGIATGIHYPAPLHLLPPFAKLQYRRGDFPVAEAYCERTVSLPIFPGITEEKASFVVKTIHDYFRNF